MENFAKNIEYSVLFNVSKWNDDMKHNKIGRDRKPNN